MKLRKYLLEGKNNYLVADYTKFAAEDDFLNSIAFFLNNDAKVLELNIDKENDKKILEMGRKIRQLTSFYETLLIIPKRLDIAQILKADGVVLGQNDTPINVARELLGEDILIGAYAKNKAEIEAMIGLAPDFMVLKDVNESAKDLFEWTRKNLAVPVFMENSNKNSCLRNIIFQ